MALHYKRNGSFGSESHMKVSNQFGQSAIKRIPINHRRLFPLNVLVRQHPIPVLKVIIQHVLADQLIALILCQLRTVFKN
jgi:hypothetical protein